VQGARAGRLRRVLADFLVQTHLFPPWGPEMAPTPPGGAERPGQPVALLDHRLLYSCATHARLTRPLVPLPPRPAPVPTVGEVGGLPPPRPRETARAARA